jgi:hypothetical protein
MDVCDRSGDKIGTVDGVYIEGDAGNARYLAVKTGWFGGKRHIVPLEDVELSGERDAVVLPYDRDRLESAPTYDDVNALTDEDESSIYGYYGRPGYWEAVRAKQTTPAPTPEIAQADVADAMARGDDPLREDIPSNLGERSVQSGERIDSDTRDDITTHSDSSESRGVRRYDW